MSTLTRTRLPHTPNYVVLTAPGDMLEEKILEMGMSVEDFARRNSIALETVRQIIDAKISLTSELAKKLEQTTQIPTAFWLRYEENYRKNLRFVEEHPDYPVVRAKE
jgi:addiction module HigA family antidote